MGGGGEGEGCVRGERRGWEGGSARATGPLLLPSNSPHFAFPRPNLPLLLLSTSPSHLFLLLPLLFLLKPRNILSNPKPMSPPKFPHLQNILVSSKSSSHLSSSLPSNSQHFAFPRAALLDAGGGRGGSLASSPGAHLLFFMAPAFTTVTTRVQGSPGAAAGS